MSNLIIAHRDPKEKEYVDQIFWLNYESKELFQFLDNEWVSLSKEYLKIKNEEKIKAIG